MLETNRPRQARNRGFTIVELLIIAPIVILTIGTFITVIVNMTGEVLATRSSNVLAYSIQDALDRIENDVKLSTTFLAVNNVTLTSPQGYDNSTANFANVDDGTNGNMLILNTLATTGNPLSSTNGLVYLTNQPNACVSPQVNQNTPMTMNIVYFLKDDGSGNGTSTLWRRTIAPSNYLTVGFGCSVPWQQPSCATAGGFCKTQDVRLVDNLKPSDFVVQYFNTADATAANSVASDNSQSPTLRSAALQSTATVGASISVTKTAAGRSISQSGTIRATRLDINASTIATAVPATIPAAPTVTGSFLTPDSAKFTWPAVPGASSYTVEQKIDSGAWTVAASNITATTYTIGALRTNVVNARVTATSSAGSSAVSNVASVTIPPWNALVLQNNWSDYTQTYATSAYTKTSAGVVVLKGLIKRTGAAVSGETIATLPPGYRPSEQLIFQTSTFDNVASRVDVGANGNIILSVGSGGWLALDGIKFLPSGSGYSFTTLPLLNGWGIYGSPPWATPAYTLDSSGRVHLKGLVNSGSGTIGTLPVGYRPSEGMYFPADATNAFGDFYLDTAGNVAPITYTNPYFSIQAMFYPASYAGWSNLTLLNGWVAYGGGLTTPQYTKGPDGIVTVKGFIKSGTITSGTVIATLPAGYRPKEVILLGGAAWNAYSRIDIQPNGDIVARVVSAGWTSLDATTFMAEQ